MRSYLSARRGQTPVKIINNLPQPSLPVEGRAWEEEDIGMSKIVNKNESNCEKKSRFLNPAFFFKCLSHVKQPEGERFLHGSARI